MLSAGIHIFIQVAFEIEMREEDANDGSFKEIDTFDITATFPSGNQDVVCTGNKGVATITLTYDIICIEPDACNTAVVSSDLIGTCTFVVFLFTFAFCSEHA